MNDTDPTQANVMLSYPLPEAEALLQEKLDAAQASFSNCEEDLDFLREQITVRCTSSCPIDLAADSFFQTMEVATARVYNWDVGQRRKENADGKGGSEEKKGQPNG